MILVVGASGVLGRESVRLLLAAGAQLRCLVRQPSSAQMPGIAGVDTLQGDLVDAASLARACVGVEAVLACAHSMMGTGRYRSEQVDGAGHRALVDAARIAGVARFVYVSVRGAAPDHPVDFFRTKAGVERHLAASGLRHTVLRPSAFMEWHVHRLLGQPLLERGATTIFGDGRNPGNFVAARDVAACAVDALAGRIDAPAPLEIGGPDNLSRREVAASYLRHSGLAGKVRCVPTALLRALRPLVGRIHPVTGRLVGMSVWTETTEQRFDAQRAAWRPSQPLTGVEDFIRGQVANHAAAREAALQQARASR